MNKDGFQFINWTRNERRQLGLKIIDLVITKTELVANQKFKSGNRYTHYIIATPKTVEYIKNFNQTHEVARPRYLPTIIPPKKWTRVWGGGYYANIINDLPLVRVH